MLTRIDVKFAGEERHFVFPNTPNMLQIVQEIFAGKTYPQIGFLSAQVDRVFDIGANIGASTVFLSFAYPNARVLAYEPGSAAFELLSRNTTGLDRITAFNTALSAEAGEGVLNLGGNSGETSSLMPNPLANGRHTEAITVERASSVFARLAGDCRSVVLKIDTEGCEVPILEDLLPHLEQVAAIYLEYHSERDRTQVEAIMQRCHLVLFSASASHPHRGENLYVRREILDSHTNYANYIIPASTSFHGGQATAA